METYSVSVVVPVYNGSKTVGELVSRTASILQKCSDQYEIILVNDGSKDDSWKTITTLSKANNQVVGINLLRNFGQHNALLCGIRRASNQIIVTLDDDLQNPPEEIPKLLEKLSNEYDVIYGAPAEEKHTLFRNLASKFVKYSLNSAMGINMAHNASAFRAFRSKLKRAFDHYESPYVSIDVLLSWGTTKFGSVIVDHKERKIGESGYTLKKLIIHALNMLTGFSVLPLQVASALGFCFTCVGLFMLIYVIGRYIIEGGSVPGFPFLASSIAIFSGAQLFALGIIGEYLARIHFRTMGRPVYIIQEEISKNSN